jgi:hypothetical protein
MPPKCVARQALPLVQGNTVGGVGLGVDPVPSDMHLTTNETLRVDVEKKTVAIANRALNQR